MYSDIYKLLSVFFIVLVMNFAFVLHSVALDGKDNDISVIIKNEIDSLNILSRQLSFINPGKSLELAQNAFALSGNYEKGMAYAYRNIANINILNEVYSLGTQYLGKAEEIFSTIQDSTGLADCYISYGHLYHKLQDIANEIKYFEKAYQVYNSKKNPDRLAVCALNLAESYFSNKEHSKSRQLVEEAVALCKESNQFQVLSACYKLLGDLELINNNKEIASDYFLKVLDLSLALGENCQKIVTIESLLHLSELNENKGKTQNQLEYLNMALNYAKQNGLSEFTISTYKKLILYYLNTNNIEEARFHVLELYEKRDSINKYQKKEQTELVNNLIRVNNLEKENEYLELANHFQRKSLKFRNIALIVIVFIVIIILTMLINLKRTKNKVKVQYDELQLQNELINKQRNELHELLVNRDRLFSIIAHDLRNPFNIILLTVELMEMDVKNQNFSRINNSLARLTRTARLTYELLEKLLLWARSQKEDITIVKLDLLLQNEIEDAILLLNNQAQFKNISIINNISEDIRVSADKDMLQTILRNIIQNAIKFTPNGGEIQVTAEIKNNLIEIRIKDSGIGMDEKMAKLIFDIDKLKIRNGTSGEPGSGLGLVLCKQFVEKNDGKILVESEPNKGTTFIISLPEPKLIG
jgi:signal transduction histidine kinase